jgi:GAF domain-containing protein
VTLRPGVNRALLKSRRALAATLAAAMAAALASAMALASA